ncbi:hypothetical protein KY084_12640 [Stakelama sp. CBK3Z-3]|uniref:Uncharacterized protein n=1 Tax=Stakelama flava TaxID=2860338 RepID=A0ABS6XNC8_9SPHN|nr:hypothetical protein [Stakelama flava]MBW4331718.1 hypothetical protein [Stakelama flava]
MGSALITRLHVLFTASPDNQGMIPMRPSRIFRSRWWALLWAAGVIWTALTVATGTPGHAHHPAADAADPDANQNDDGQLHDASGAPVTDDQIRAIANLIG